MSDHPYLPYIATKGRAYVNEDTWGRIAPVDFNSYGDRGPEPDMPKKRRRLIAFGGSTTFGARSPLEKTWPKQLESKLSESRYEVINAAQNGATTADTLVNLSLLHAALEPDYVLVYHGTNDLESSYTRGFKTDYSHRRRKIPSVPPIFEAMPRWLDYSAFFVLTRNLFIGGVAQGDLWSRYTRSTDTDFENGPFGLETFRRNLESIIAVARTHGARIVLGTFLYYRPWADANMGRAFADAWEIGIEEQNRIIRDVANSSSGVLLADVAAVSELGEEHFWDFCHLTESGNELIAREFVRVIREAELEE
jgi:lysophospholipase L1-like esterase